MNPCSGGACFLAGRFGHVSTLNLRYPLKADVPCHDIWPAPEAELALVHQHSLEIVIRRCGYVKNVKTRCAFGGHRWRETFNILQSGTTWGSAVRFCVKRVLVNSKLWQIKQLTPFASQKRLCSGYVPTEEMVLYFLTQTLCFLVRV